jgi:glycosyltransferase involved in cell wall biosynthesis
LLNDIEAQDFPHQQIEVILIDSLSTDSTKKILRRFAKTAKSFHKVVVLDNPGRFQPQGWNVAVENFTGDALIRVDAHARIPADFVRLNAATLEAGQDVCGGVRPTISQESGPWQETLLLAEESAFGSSPASYRRAGAGGYVKSLFHGAYRRRVFDEVGLFDERLLRTEDNDFHYRIRRAGFKIFLNPKIHSQQLVRSSLGQMLQQKQANGSWIGRTLFISPRCLSLFHFVPLVFVLALIALAAVGLTFSWIPFFVLVGVYIIANIFIIIKSIIVSNHKNPSMLALPLVFLLIHLASGFGSLLGLIEGLFGGLPSR